MKSNRANSNSPFRMIEEQFWNLVGGSLVVGMLAGVFYALTGTIAAEVYGVDRYWDLKYFYRIFAGLLLFYLVLPSIFTALLGALLGSSAGRKKRKY